ncbi:uncharacterized protein LOC144918426 [Branchiostoma floridae x Branchiostoma belcheri]
MVSTRRKATNRTEPTSSPRHLTTWFQTSTRAMTEVSSSTPHPIESRSPENISTVQTYVTTATESTPGTPVTGSQVSVSGVSTEVTSKATTSSRWTTGQPVEEFLLNFKILEGYNWTDGLLDSTTEEYHNLTSVLRNALWEMYGNSSLASYTDDIIIDGFTEGCVAVYSRLFLTPHTATEAELSRVFRRAVTAGLPTLPGYIIHPDSIRVLASNVTSVPTVRSGDVTSVPTVRSGDDMTYRSPTVRSSVMGSITALSTAPQ